MNRLKVLKVLFDLSLPQSLLPKFRGAVIELVGRENVLFHNHLDEDKFRYSYPLIQYKTWHKKAMLVCVGEGTDEIGSFFENRKNVEIDGEVVPLEIHSVRADWSVMQVCDGCSSYSLFSWIGLNNENYTLYNTIETEVERIQFLENILKGNLLSFAKGIGYTVDKNIDVQILALKRKKIVTYKDTKFLSFNLDFRTNMSIPDFIGIGKGVSVGFGTVVRKNDKKLKTECPQTVFLLGGHDLEMNTIKELLEKRADCVVLDKDLQWNNARLSMYREDLEQYSNSEIYGVELNEDIALPETIKGNYHRIDHHNDMNGLPSSLEQVAAVLGVELNRYQRLVAANDSGYIPAMKALLATDEEVLEIRRCDRDAQGVTEDDERLAEESIVGNLCKGKRLWVVKSLTSKFSPICDRLYPYKNLLIYTDREWMFYGEGKPELVSQLSEDIRQKKVFYGGAGNGYVGCVSGMYSQKEIEQFVKQIKNKYDA